MSKSSVINAEKKALVSIFKDFWFVIPEYQRSYVWGTDNITELLDDLWFANENKSEDEYFLGSLVLRNLGNSNFLEYEVMDGQQRLTTLLMLMAVIRDSTDNPSLRSSCRATIIQSGNQFQGIPERLRIIYRIRDAVSGFVVDHIQEDGNSVSNEILKEKVKLDNVSISNMANAILVMKEFFTDKNKEDIEKFAQFLFLKVVVIYVATSNRDDAFRMFTILNNRGIPLTNADILKSINIGEIKDSVQNKKYAELWERIESAFGDDFDRFLSFVRTIIIKEKARVNLLKEFEDNIYDKNLLKQGKDTIEYMHKCKEAYDKVIKFEGINLDAGYKNLITIMLIGLPSDEWIPPILYFYSKFGQPELYKFLEKLEYKFSADWILQLSPTERIANMNKILKSIDQQSLAMTVIDDSELFKIDKESLRSVLNSTIYGRRFARYVLLKYEYTVSDNTVHLSDYNTISVEHVLPQNPNSNSQWVAQYTDTDRQYWTNRLANLVLISKKKNSSLSNMDFIAKRENYLKNRVDVFVGSKVFLYQENDWTPSVLSKRQNEMLGKLI